MTIPFMKTAQNLTLCWGGKTKIVPIGTSAYDEVIKLIKANADPDSILKACDLGERVKLKCHSSGLFSTDEDNIVWVGNEKCPKVLSDRIVDFVELGLPFEPLIKFWNNCVANPDPRARTDLFAFLQQNGHAITEDGCFIAYRYVNENFKDCRTNSMDNAVGKTVRMERSQCDADPNVTCSAGLHVASCNYAWVHGGGRYKILVKVNPKDVVAIPTDYSNQKMRCCEFTVLAIHESEKPVQAPLVDDMMKPKTRNDYDDYGDGSEEDADEEADVVLWDSRHAASKPIPVPANKVVKNRGWENCRDSKGRFYRKYI